MTPVAWDFCRHCGWRFLGKWLICGNPHCPGKALAPAVEEQR